MSDISKCHGRDCPDHQRCWRYLAPAGRVQSWIAADKVRKPGQPCVHLWEVEDEVLMLSARAAGASPTMWRDRVET